MSEVDVRAVVLRERERLFPMRGRRGGVAMIPNPQPVLVRKLADAFMIVVTL